MVEVDEEEELEGEEELEEEEKLLEKELEELELEDELALGELELDKEGEPDVGVDGGRVRDEGGGVRVDVSEVPLAAFVVVAESIADVGKAEGTPSRAAPAQDISHQNPGTIKITAGETRLTVMGVEEPLGVDGGQAAGQALGVAARTRVDGVRVRELKERQCYESKGEGAVKGAHGGGREPRSRA